MNGKQIIKGIVKLYFVGAVAASLAHLMRASEKLGAEHVWETIAAPVAIDLMFIVAMILRSEKWASDTRRIGFRLMLVMGTVSMAGNIYAGMSSAFGIIFGAMLPTFLLVSEWLIGRIRTAEDERSERARKAAATRKRNARRAERERKAQERALDSLVNA